MSAVLRGLANRMKSVVRAVRTTTAPVDTGSVQTVQVKHSDAQTVDGVPVMFHFGFSACLPPGSDGIAVHISGDTSNGIIVATAHQPTRPKGLTPGQVMVYDAAGSTILLDGQGGIALTPSKGAVTVDGTLIVTEDATIGGKGFLEHRHGDVQTGNSPTGVPV